MKKANLTPGERIKVAYFYTFKGINQADLADVFNVNQGRINEAIKSIEKAAQDPFSVRNYKGRKVKKKARRS